MAGKAISSEISNGLRILHMVCIRGGKSTHEGDESSRVQDQGQTSSAAGLNPWTYRSHSLGRRLFPDEEIQAILLKADDNDDEIESADMDSGESDLGETDNEGFPIIDLALNHQE